MRFKFCLNLILILLLSLKVQLFSAFGRVYESVGKNKFYIENEQKYNWMEAFSSCLEMNMSLVTIDTSSKSSEINRLVLETFGNRVNLWVAGVRNRYPSQHFIWLPTGKRFSYTFWEGQNPDFSGNSEYCVHIGWGSKMEWNDKACNHEHGFICEPQQQHGEIVQLQQKLQQEFEKQQKLQAQVLEGVKRETTLLRELESLRKEKFENLQHQLNEIKNQKYNNISFHFHQYRQ